MQSIQEYKTLVTTDHASAILSCDDFQLSNDELLILEIGNDGRTTIHKARTAPSDNAPFKPMFHSWVGSPCNWKG